MEEFIVNWYFETSFKRGWSKSYYRQIKSKYDEWKHQLKQICECVGLEYDRISINISGVRLDARHIICSSEWMIESYDSIYRCKGMPMSRPAFLAYLLETNEKKQEIIAAVNMILPMPIAEELVQHISMVDEIKKKVLGN